MGLELHYFQTLAHFAPEGIKISLVAAPFEYVDLPLELDRYTVEIFRFTFHWKLMNHGVYGPEGRGLARASPDTPPGKFKFDW